MFDALHIRNASKGEDLRWERKVVVGLSGALYVVGLQNACHDQVRLDSAA